MPKGICEGKERGSLKKIEQEKAQEEKLNDIKKKIVLFTHWKN